MAVHDKIGVPVLTPGIEILMDGDGFRPISIAVGKTIIPILFRMVYS